MPTNRDFAHVAPNLPPDLLERLAERQAREKLRSLTAALRAELEERLAEDREFGPVLAPAMSAKRKDFWLPRPMVDRIRALAVTCDASPSHMLVTILAAPVEPNRKRRSRQLAVAAAPASKRRSPEPA